MAIFETIQFNIFSLTFPFKRIYFELGNEIYLAFLPLVDSLNDNFA